MNRKETFEKNIAALSKRDLQLAQRLKECGKSNKYELIRSENNIPNLLIKRQSDQLLFYDPLDPMKHVEQYLEALTIKYAPIVVFMGFGLGYHLDYFIKQVGRRCDTKEIIIYEKDVDLFRLSLEAVDFGNLLNHPNIHFFAGDDPEGSFSKLRGDIFLRHGYDMRSIKIIPLPESIMLANAYYLRALENVKKAARQLMAMVGNDSFDSLVGMEHMFLNLRHIFSNPGLNHLYGKFKGKPGVLVASGPSLNKNMHLLKGLRDNALIISCDASLAPLMKKGIRPHLVTSLEREPEIILYYSTIRDFEKIYFITLPILRPETIESFRGKKFIAYRDYKYFDWLEADKGSLYVGHSVANLAFKILIHLNCDPIILIGQDLSFSQEGDTHCVGNVVRNRNENILKRPIIEIEGNDGRPVKSIRPWDLFRLRFEEDIASYTGTCINATEGGAKIYGAEVMTFKKAIDMHCTEAYHPQAILDEVYSRFYDPGNVNEEMKRISLKSRGALRRLEKTIYTFKAAMDDAKSVEYEIIRPFMEDGSCSDSDMQRLLSVEKKWLELSDVLLKESDLSEIVVQILNPYDVWLASELSFLKEIYTDPKILSMARVKKMKEWFAVAGSLLIFIRNVLKNAEKTINEELSKETLSPSIGIQGSYIREPSERTPI